MSYPLYVIPLCNQSIGTLGFEAALICSGVGSGAMQNRQYAFHTFPCTPEPTLTFLKRRSQQSITSLLSSSSPTISFSDLNADAVNAIKDNIRSFLYSVQPEVSDSTLNSQMLFEAPQQFDFFVCPLEKLVSIQHNTNQSNKATVLLLNPPFGLRLGKKTSQTQLYQRIAMRVIEMHQYLHLKRSENEHKVVDSLCEMTPILMGYCICSNESTTQEFIRGLTKNITSRFCTKIHTFSHGGKERYVVSFRSL